jgi:hypothetical protein
MDATYFVLVPLGALAVWAVAATARSVANDGYHAITTRGPDEGFDHRF